MMCLLVEHRSAILTRLGHRPGHRLSLLPLHHIMYIKSLFFIDQSTHESSFPDLILSSIILLVRVSLYKYLEGSQGASRKRANRYVCNICNICNINYLTHTASLPLLCAVGGNRSEV